MGHPAARFAASYKSSVAMAAHSKTLSHYRTKEMFDRANRSETTNYTPVRSMTVYPIYPSSLVLYSKTISHCVCVVQFVHIDCGLTYSASDNMKALYLHFEFVIVFRLGVWIQSREADAQECGNAEDRGRD